MSFAQSGIVFAHYHRKMSKNRKRPVKGLVKENLAGSIGNMVFTPNDMGDVHQRIINYHRKVISRHAI